MFPHLPKGVEAMGEGTHSAVYSRTVDSGAGMFAGRPADTRSNFGARGWSILVFEAALLWIGSGSVVHGLNVVLPAISSAFHLDYTELLALATPASWASIVAGPCCARICEKKGPKFLIIVSLAIGGVCFGLLGTWGSTVGFATLFTIVCFFDTSFAYIGGPTMIANWFPRKKGLALGWCTIGQTLSTATYVPFLAFMLATFGVQKGFWSISLFMFAMIVVMALFSADTPEQLNCSPDNDPMTSEEIARSRRERETYVCPFTTRQLLGMRDVWFMGLAYGGIYVVIVGLVSQLVPRLMAMGFEQKTAILYLTISASCGVPGAYAWGWFSQKVGIKRASIAYTVWYMAALVLNIFELNTVTMWISLVMIGFSLGGATNLSTAVVAEKFPRGAFVKAWGVVNPIQSVVRCCAFAILAFGLTYLGGYAGAYAILAVIAFVAMLLIWNTNTASIG